jgi:hypothetical protein
MVYLSYLCHQPKQLEPKKSISMKKLFTFLMIGMLATAGYAQKGLSLGANFMPLTSSIINQNTWGNGREYDYAVTFNTSLGFDIGYNFTDQLGIYSGYWSTKLGQNYTDSYDNSEWERNLKFKYNIIPVMLKFSSSSSRVNFLGGVGILIASMKQADQEWLEGGAAFSQELTNPITTDVYDLGESDATSRFNKNDIILNLEVGAKIKLIDKLFVDAALNFGYGVKDINQTDWQIKNNSNVYDASHNAFGGLKIGVSYMLLGK